VLRTEQPNLAGKAVRIAFGPCQFQPKSLAGKAAHEQFDQRGRAQRRTNLVPERTPAKLRYALCIN
jgi:hypothetical protein